MFCAHVGNILDFCCYLDSLVMWVSVPFYFICSLVRGGDRSWRRPSHWAVTNPLTTWLLWLATAIEKGMESAGGGGDGWMVGGGELWAQAAWIQRQDNFSQIVWGNFYFRKGKERKSFKITLYSNNINNNSVIVITIKYLGHKYNQENTAVQSKVQQRRWSYIYLFT